MYPYGAWVKYTYYVEDIEEDVEYPGIIVDRWKEGREWKVRVAFPDGEYFDTSVNDERMAIRRATETYWRAADDKVRTDCNGKCEKCSIDYETAEEYYEHRCPGGGQGSEQTKKKKGRKEQAHKERKATSAHEKGQGVRASEEDAGDACDLSASESTPQRKDTDEEIRKEPAAISRAGGEPMRITDWQVGNKAHGKYGEKCGM